MAYTPGVARGSMAIHEHPVKAWALTIQSNTVAVVSDGTPCSASATSARPQPCR